MSRTALLCESLVEGMTHWNELSGRGCTSNERIIWVNAHKHTHTHTHRMRRVSTGAECLTLNGIGMSDLRSSESCMFVATHIIRML